MPTRVARPGGLLCPLLSPVVLLLGWGVQSREEDGARREKEEKTIFSRALD